MYIVSLVSGDWSHDGHGQTHTTVVSSNKTVQQIQTAHQAGIDKLVRLYGVEIYDAFSELCDEYEDNRFPWQLRQQLVEAGILIETESEAFCKRRIVDGVWHFVPTPNEDTSLDVDSFVDLYIKVAQYGDPELVISVLDPHTTTLQIGGYGLFYS